MSRAAAPHPRRRPAAPAGAEDWQSLERVYRAFPSAAKQRSRWRQGAARVDARLGAQGHHSLPALVPCLVHARLATALLAAGWRAKSDLRAHSVLCLGCHAGLEVRMLRDFGVQDVHGVEIRALVVRESVAEGLVAAADISVGSFWDWLEAPASGGRLAWDATLALAPQDLALDRLWAAAEPHLAPAGRVVVVAHPPEVGTPGSEWRSGPALEGAMRWYARHRTGSPLGDWPAAGPRLNRAEATGSRTRW